MSEPRTVYVVTRGSDDDYHIESVFSARGLADAYIAKHPELQRYEFDVEEFALDADAGAELMIPWEATVDLDTGEVTHHGIGPEVMMDPTACVVGEPWDGADGHRRLMVRSPVSAEHAGKVAVERRQAWLRERAQGEGRADG